MKLISETSFLLICCTPEKNHSEKKGKMGDKNRWGRWNKMNRGRETATGRQHWCSLTLTESIFWQASAFCNNLEIISVHKGPAVWQSKCSVPDQSLWFSQLLVSVCTCLTSISGPFSVIKVRMMELGRDWKGETKPQTEQKNINTDSETDFGDKMSFTRYWTEKTNFSLLCCFPMKPF